jgi:hypothetical protein
VAVGAGPPDKQAVGQKHNRCFEECRSCDISPADCDARADAAPADRTREHDLFYIRSTGCAAWPHRTRGDFMGLE